MSLPAPETGRPEPTDAEALSRHTNSAMPQWDRSVSGPEVRLDVGTTKNGEGRVFPITKELRWVLETQQQVAAALRVRGTIVPYVFCYAEGAKAGQRITESGYNKAWRAARVAAGCP